MLKTCFFRFCFLLIISLAYTDQAYTGLRVFCSSNKYTCENNASCIPKTFLCDGSYDCADGSDETNCEDGVECKLKGCSHVCEVTNNKAKCLCLSGYQLQKDQKSCQDIDECQSKNICSQKCVNTQGSFQCECEEGYILKLDGSCWSNSTDDISSNKLVCSNGKFACENGASCLPESFLCDGSNDCVDGSDEKNCENGLACKLKQCEQSCKKITRRVKDPAYRQYYNERYINEEVAECTCSEGYTVQTTGTCKDIDECLNHQCSQACVNTVGSYTCSCIKGYRLLEDGFSCKAKGEYPSLIQSLATKINIYLLEANRSYSYDITYENTILRASMNRKTSEIFWLETYVNGGVIKKMYFNGTQSKEKALGSKFLNPEGFAIDWLTSKIYVTDKGTGKISACTMDVKHCVTVISDMESEPVAIIVNPKIGEMYWSEWGSSRGIYKAAMDGSNKTLLVKNDIKEVIDLDLDPVTNTLFWCDLKSSKINWMSVKDRDDLSKFVDVGGYVETLTVFEDFIYYIKMSRDLIERYNKRTNKKDGFSLKVSGARNINMYHHVLFPLESTQNPCKKSKCSQLCLLSIHSTFSCACFEGYKLSGDNLSCTNENFSEEHETTTTSNSYGIEENETITTSNSYGIEENETIPTDLEEVSDIITHYIHEGEDVNLPCVDVDNDAHSTLWKKSDIFLISLNYNIFEPDPRYKVEQNKSLTIRNAFPRHSGNYSCYIQSDPTLFLTHQLIVQDKVPED